VVRRRAGAGGRRREESRTILLVEPDVDLRQLLVEFLNRAGYIVVPAYTGEGAVLLSGKIAIDLLLLDLGVPDLEGFALLSRLQKLSPGAAVVVLTSLLDEVIDRQCRIAGADEVVRRPIENLVGFGDVLARALKAHDVSGRTRRVVEPGGTTGAG
jgi:DNA-binding response OmpR family regulator